MKKQSIWLEGLKFKPKPKLTKGIHTDILIIGGGIAGISTAFSLKDSKLDITLIDESKIGTGVSAHTTGKLTFLQELIYQKLEANFGQDICDLYLKSQKEAIEIVKQNVVKFNIDCDFEGVASYVFTNNIKHLKNFRKEELILNRNKIAYKIKNEISLFPVKYSIRVDDTAVFHPVKYILALKEICLKKGIRIYENTKAITLKQQGEEYLVDTPNGYIRAKKVIICTHYPFFLTPGFIPLRTHIERSYLCAGTVARTKKISAITNTYPTKSLRYYQGKHPYLLYIAESHKLGNNLDYQANYNLLMETANEFMPKIDFIWQNQDIMTNDYLPLIGKISKDNNNLLIATGFNTWGMTNGVIAGKILSDLILEKTNPYTFLFAPYRGTSIDQIKNFMIDSFQISKSYIISKIKSYYSFYLDEVKIKQLNGKKVGIYIDEFGKYHIVSRICPHLKCSLTFNTFSKTWDCPCHGSRFDIDGNCLNGPSAYNIKI